MGHNLKKKYIYLCMKEKEINNLLWNITPLKSFYPCCPVILDNKDIIFFERGFKQKKKEASLGCCFFFLFPTVMVLYLKIILMVNLPFKTKSSNLSQCT